MHENGSDRIRLFVRLEVEQVIRDGLPHAHRLVRFAGVGSDNVLEDWQLPSESRRWEWR